MRWCGNESGSARTEEWAVVPRELCDRSEVQTGPGPLPGDLSFLYNTDDDAGSLGLILRSRGLVFTPAEIDMSIRPGWFYHPEQEPRSLDRLVQTWIRSVGANATFNLNVPPMPNGRFDPADVRRLSELGETLRTRFGTDLAEGAEIRREDGEAFQTLYTVKLPRAVRPKYVEVDEDIAQGQRVESFLIENYLEGERHWPCLYGRTVGRRRILEINAKHDVDELRIRVISSRGPSQIRRVRVW